MDMSDSKPFEPADIDETLTRVVTHGGKTHLLFPFVNGVAAEPKYSSIGMVIAGSAATVQDFQALASMAQESGRGRRVAHRLQYALADSGVGRGRESRAQAAGLSVSLRAFVKL